MTEEAEDVAAPSGASEAARSRPQEKSSVTTDEPGGTAAPDEFEVERKGPSWGMVLLPVLQNRAIPVRSRLFYAVLCCYADKRTGVAFPKVTTLGEALGSGDTVSRAIKDLVKAKVLQAKRPRLSSGRMGRYRFTLLDQSAEMRSGPVRNPAEVQSAEMRTHTSTDHSSTTDQKDPAAGAASAPKRGKLDLREAIDVEGRFRGWYAKKYGRIHAEAIPRQRWMLASLIRRIERDKAQVPEIATDTTVEIIGAVCTVATRNASQLWFLKNAPLDLDTLLRHWPKLWDRFIEEGQNVGVVAKVG